jgi:glycyl-tRNA synthetase beta chain
MPNYLLEIGSEELPANFLIGAEEDLKSALENLLIGENLSFEQVITYSTPRRLAIYVKGLPASQATIEKKVKGPPVKSSFDAAGKPLPAASGFAAKNQLKVEELANETVNGVEHLIANVTVHGLPTKAVLVDLVPKAIRKLSGERMMRWGSGDLKFSRPIRWIVSLLDGETVAFRLENLSAGNTSYGHRVLSAGEIKIQNADQYAEALKAAGVIVNREERRNLIRMMVTEAAASVHGVARKTNDELLEEVINIVESPCAVVGDFAKEYLELPAALIETVMVHHQRYFPVEKNAAGNGHDPELLPHFITIANNTLPQAKQQIKLGNERVLKARLADGRFFYFDDQKTPLSKRAEQLGQLTFQEGLGSYQDKVERLKSAASKAAPTLKLSKEESEHLIQALTLSKADLVTNLVRELPELQGHVGSWYAKKEGQAPEVVNAIASHYAPRSADDSVPKDKIGQIVSLMDRIDTLAGGFMMGRKPSGSSDPYALRRQAQGLIDICLATSTTFAPDLSELIDEIASHLHRSVAKPKLNLADTKSELSDFLLQRLKTRLDEKGYSREIVEAVTSSRNALSDIRDTEERCKALANFIATNSGSEVLRAGIRVANIIGGEEPSCAIEQLKLSEPIELKLLTDFSELAGKQAVLEKTDIRWKEQSYKDYLESFLPIVPSVDNFFEKLMVNDPDPAKRENRRGLLANINQRLRFVADFSKLTQGSQK